MLVRFPFSLHLSLFNDFLETKDAFYHQQNTQISVPTP